MKNVTYFLVGALLVSILFAGCKKEDDTPKNQMIYNETEYDLAQGFLENYGKWDGTEDYNIDLILVSSGFTIHEVNGEIDSVSGKGHLIYFELFTADPDKLTVGDYIYDDNETGKAGTFDDAGCALDFDAQTEIGTELEINGGKLTVVQNGDTYEVKFDVTATNGKHITGFFKGGLKYYDYRDNKKSSTQIAEKESFLR